MLPGPDVDDLTDAFDRAVPEWCRYFELDPARAAGWQMTGFVMHEKNCFVGAGMLPADLPPFPNGYSRGRYLWLYDQPDGYYRRHLLLHEGTHAFMGQFLGALGPPWYAEGMAELLGTHRWQGGVLTLGYVPQDKIGDAGLGTSQDHQRRDRRRPRHDACRDFGLRSASPPAERTLRLVLGSDHFS